MPRHNLGLTLAEQGHLDAAIGHYERALAINPDNPEGALLSGLYPQESG